MKRCPSCLISKDRSEFYEYPYRHDGLSSYCKPCVRLTSAKYIRSPKGKETMAKKSKRMFIKHRSKMYARGVLRHAVKMGRIKKPQECERCGATGKIDGHHTDYSKPLDVMWLCDICHKQEHGKLVDLTLIKAKGAVTV